KREKFNWDSQKAEDKKIQGLEKIIISDLYQLMQLNDKNIDLSHEPDNCEDNKKY
ncbi:20115_t:CDS:2, partial [Racocetra persica]